MIEILAALLLVGLMAAVAVLGVVTGVKGYLLTKDNAHLVQKSQLAFARLGRELTEISNVSGTSGTSLVYERDSSQYSLALVGGEIKLRNGSSLPDANNGDVLIDNVNGFTLTYLKADGSAWLSGENVRLLSTIRIDLVLEHPDDEVGGITFTTTINPRNTGVKAGPYGS